MNIPQLSFFFFNEFHCIPFKISLHEIYYIQFYRDKLSDKIVNVAVTPNGYADGLATHNEKEYFVLPEEQQMTMGNFLNKLDENG